MALPTLHMAAHCLVDGEESSEIMESDIVTCAARVVLTRHSHLTPGSASDTHLAICLHGVKGSWGWVGGLVLEL